MNNTTYKTEWVDTDSSGQEFQKNFKNVYGHKVHVEDFINGKATYKLNFSGYGNDCFIKFEFPKGWTKKQMLEKSLQNLGFKTSRDSFMGWVTVS